MSFDFSKIQDPMVQQYLKEKYGNGNKVKQAQESVDTANMLGVAAPVFDGVVNAFNQPRVLDNRMQDLGKAPTMTSPEKVKSDVSGLQKQAQTRLDMARSDEDNAVKVAFEQRKAELAAEVAAAKAGREQMNWGLDYNAKLAKAEEDARHNKAMERKAASTGGISNDPLAPVPKELRDNYLTSESKVKEFDQALLDVDPLISEAQNFTLREHVTPNAFGGNDFDSVQAKIAAAIMNRVPGIRSDADFKNLVVPMIPRPGDPPNVAKDKADGLRRLLKSSRPVNEVGNVYMPKPAAPTIKQGGASGSWDDGLDAMSDEDLTKLHSQIRK